MFYYIISLIICVYPMIYYLFSDWTMSKDGISGLKISFIVGLIPYINIALALYFVVVLIYYLLGVVIDKLNKKENL